MAAPSRRTIEAIRDSTAARCARSTLAEFESLTGDITDAAKTDPSVSEFAWLGRLAKTLELLLDEIGGAR